MRSSFSSRCSRCRRGGVTPLTVLSLALLLGVVAVAVDGGSLLEERRHVQAAADAAALAAAADLYANYSTNQGTDSSSRTALASALASAAANGFSNDGVQSVVTVNVSPQKYQGGPNVGQALPAGYVEVIVQYNAGRTFSNVFGSGAIPVRARAVARGQWTPISKNVIALNLSASNAVSVAGGGGLLGGLLGGGLLGGGGLKVNGVVQVNSNSSTAISLTGGGSLTALAIDLIQGVAGLLGALLGLLGLGGVPPAINTVLPTADPLRYLPDPDPVKLGLTNYGTITANDGKAHDLYPGIYNGISVTNNSTINLHANSDGTPGIYFLQGGGFTVSGPSNVQMATAFDASAGIMLYNGWSRNADAISLSGSGSLNLTPPSSGLYTGLCIFQKRGTRSTPGPIVTLSGSASANVTGTLYAAHAKVSLSGAAGISVTLCGQIIADTLAVSGGATINIDPGGNPVARTRTIGLVE